MQQLKAHRVVRVLGAMALPVWFVSAAAVAAREVDSKFKQRIQEEVGSREVRISEAEPGTEATGVVVLEDEGRLVVRTSDCDAEPPEVTVFSEKAKRVDKGSKTCKKTGKEEKLERVVERHEYSAEGVTPRLGPAPAIIISANTLFLTFVSTCVWARLRTITLPSRRR